MSDTTTTTALDVLLRDYRHLEARGDDDVINEFRDGLVGDALIEREKLASALRECIAAMSAAHTVVDNIPSQPRPAIDGVPEELAAALAKARAALGE